MVPESEKPKVKKRRGVGNRKRNAADDAQEARWAERRSRCVELRHAGLSWRKIQAELGYGSHADAMKDYDRAMHEIVAPSVEQHRARANVLLDMVINGHAIQAQEGNPQSAQVVIKAVAQHAKINGYEAPKVIDVNSTSGNSPADVRRAVAAAFPGGVVYQGPRTDGSEPS